MTTIIQNLPSGLDVSAFTETESVTLPEITIRGENVFIPVLVRQITRTFDDVETTVYLYFDVRSKYVGGNISDYEAFCKLYYKQIRRFFYGTADWESGKKDDYTWTAHELAVKNAFWSPVQIAAPSGIARFDEIRTAFWADVDSACASVGKTRGDLPAYFTAESMVSFAAANGMSAADIAVYSTKFYAVSLNLLHNSRNWKELFV